MPMRRLPLASLLLAASVVTATPALAQNAPPPYPLPAHPMADSRPDWNRVNWAPGQRESYERARAGWLDECRRRMAPAYAERDDGVGGGLIGALFGGLIGNRLGGRHNRTFGTIAGAAVGGVAGAAIDKAEDRDRPAESGYCESYLDYYSYTGTYQHGGHGQGQPVMMMTMAPMGGHMQHAAYQGPAKPECTEEVVYEDVDVPVTQPARRMIPRRPAPTKRMPDKRIPL